MIAVTLFHLVLIHFVLVWAALVGFLIFSETPNVFTILGGVIVMGAVLYIARRERQEGRAPTETVV